MWLGRRTRPVRPGWFRAHVRPANHESWDACETSLLSCPLERRRITELEAELDGGFDRPIIVSRESWWSRKLRVADGVHRAIAAMRIGANIPVQHGFSADTSYDDSDVYVVTSPGTDIDTLLDTVLSSASFRSSAGPWIQSDTASASIDGTVRLNFPRHGELRTVIATDFQKRLTEAGITAHVKFLGREDDDDSYEQRSYRQPLPHLHGSGAQGAAERDASIYAAMAASGDQDEFAPMVEWTAAHRKRHLD